MKEFEEYASRFGVENIDTSTWNENKNELTSIPPQVRHIMSLCKEKPLRAGAFLGSKQGKQIISSINFLRILGKQSNRKIILNKKAAWLFICGRDVFAENILSKQESSNIVLVIDEDDNVLGLAKKQGNTYKNIYDVGELLRREQKKKR